MAKGRKTGGRQKGTPNKVTGDLRSMVLTALDQAGGVRYLKRQAARNPSAFMALVGKCLPKEIKVEDVSLEKLLATARTIEAEMPPPTPPLRLIEGGRID